MVLLGLGGLRVHSSGLASRGPPLAISRALRRLIRRLSKEISPLTVGRILRGPLLIASTLNPKPETLNPKP